MNKFEVVSRFKDSKINLIPTRKTNGSAGYDFYVAEDIIIPPYYVQLDKMAEYNSPITMGLEEVASKTKELKARPTLVSSGVKCQLDEGLYLELSTRSSTPLKYWLILANSVGIIDSDYYNNEDNEGEIFFQLINLSPWSIRLKVGDCIGQGFIKQYDLTDNDFTDKIRKGGFGSTDDLGSIFDAFFTRHQEDGK